MGLNEVFSTRKPRVHEGLVQIDDKRVWVRIYFRSVRLGTDRAILTLIEDLTPEKRQILANQRYQELLRRFGDELEKRVEKRTAELKKLNEALRSEVDETRRLKSELDASRASFASIVERATDGIIVVDSTGAVVFANKAAAAFCNISQEDLVGSVYCLPVCPGKTAEVEREIVAGRTRTLEVRVESTDWNGKAAFLAILRDISERKTAERELLKAQKVESLEVISGGIAHDFNNLLTGIATNVSLAKMRVNKHGPAYTVLKNAERGVERAKLLTHQLLTFTKGGEPVKAPTHLSTLLRESVDLAMSGSNVAVQFAIPQELWTVEVDRQQIGQVIQNLLINASQAMPHGGKVIVTTENSLRQPNGLEQEFGEQSTKFVKVSIRDHGSGISPEDQSKIFDPYFTTKAGGSGLGLATSYSILRRHGGFIEVESELGIGTTFLIYLPVSLVESEDFSDRTGEFPVLGRGRILLMDDDEAILESSRELLGLLGYEVECAREGTEAVQLYKKVMESGKPFDAVIIDLTIPGGLGGKATIAKLLELNPDVRAIVTSGYSEDPVMSDHEKYGFRGVMHKPHKASELAWELHRVLNLPL
jgi:two-component system, cell cycle sensor histidine kinase and response regulator CckA